MALTPEGKGHKLTVGVRCGDCLHFKVGPKYYEELCSELGYGPQHKPCPAFTPNHYKLVRLEPDILRVLNKVTSEMSPSQSRLLAFMFKNIGRLKAAELQFGQRVYFCLGEDYLSHYFRGYVIGLSHDKQNILISSKLKEAKTATTLSLMFDSVLDEKQFLIKKRELEKKQRLVLPEEAKVYRKARLPIAEYIKQDGTLKTKYLFKKQGELDYVPPTLESAPSSWLYPKTGAQGKKKVKPQVGKARRKKRLAKGTKVKRKNGKTVVTLNRYK